MMVKNRIRWTAAAVCGLALSLMPVARAPADNITQYNLIEYNSRIVGRLFVPDNYDPTQSYPVVMFMHGLGEAGTDNAKQANSHTNNLLAQAKANNVFVYIPQSPSGVWRDTYRLSAINTLAQLSRDYNIDTGRMYITGLSAGGNGIRWEMNRYPDLFAAYVPMSSSVTITSSVAAKMVNSPVWDFTARDDTSSNRLVITRNSINNLIKAQGQSAINWDTYTGQGDPTHANNTPYYTDGSHYFEYNKVRYTEYKSGGHSDGAWERAYGESYLWSWMLEQQRVAPAALGMGQTLLYDLGRLIDPAKTDGTTDVDSGGKVWNDPMVTTSTAVAGIHVGFSRTTTGQATGVSLVVLNSPISAIKANVTDSPVGPTGITGLDDSVTQDFWYATGSQTSRSMALQGLIPDHAYEVKLLAAVDATEDNSWLGRYTVAGQTLTFNASANTTGEWMTFSNVLADTNGQILIMLSKDPSSTGAKVVLNALSITAVPEPASTVGALLGTFVLLTRRTRKE